jgi:hypothetical protein
MDPNAAAVAAQPATSGFVDWITQYGNIVAFVGQILYWVALIVLLAYAVAQYKRWVNFQLGTGKSGRLRTGEATDADEAPAKKQKPAKSVSVEEFVE